MTKTLEEKIKDVKKVQKTCIKDGVTEITEISIDQADDLYRNAFMRKGHVVLEGRKNGFSVKDDREEIIIEAIFC